MNLLVVDTTTDNIVIAISVSGTISSRVEETQGRKHNSKVLEIIDELLIKSGLSINDIDYLGIVVGPGSFTGIRIGVATINALSIATGAPIVEMTTLEMLDDGTDKTVLLDCKHGNFYAGYFINGNAIYSNISENELESISSEIVYFKESNPNLIIKKCLEKIDAKKLTMQAKPFYLKKSSAERNNNEI